MQVLVPICIRNYHPQAPQAHQSHLPRNPLKTNPKIPPPICRKFPPSGAQSRKTLEKPMADEPRILERGRSIQPRPRELRRCPLHLGLGKGLPRNLSEDRQPIRRRTCRGNGLSRRPTPAHQPRQLPRLHRLRRPRHVARRHRRKTRHQAPLRRSDRAHCGQRPGKIPAPKPQNPKTPKPQTFIYSMY